MIEELIRHIETEVSFIPKEYRQALVQKLMDLSSVIAQESIGIEYVDIRNRVSFRITAANPTREIKQFNTLINFVRAY